MENLENDIAFKLVKITSEQFAIFEENHTVKGDFQIKTEIKFGFDKDRRIISVLPSFTFLSNNLPFLKIEIGCHFEIKEDAWKSIIESDNVICKVPVLLLRHLSVLAICTARGFLHSKIENTE